MLQFDRSNCYCHWILFCDVGQSQRREDGWGCRGREPGINQTAGPSIAKPHWRNIEVFFSVDHPVRSLLPNKMVISVAFVSSFRMLPFPWSPKTGICYCGNWFAQAVTSEHKSPYVMQVQWRSICYWNHICIDSNTVCWCKLSIAANSLQRWVAMRSMPCPLALILTKYYDSPVSVYILPKRVEISKDNANSCILH